MDYLQAFAERFSKLNPEQKRAVELIEGPVMVIAGPGTGKTEVLSARIAQILNAGTGAEPHNILCLTFTEAGTIAMRKRLLEFIGPTAHKVGIYTFHGFCNEIIQQNLEYFGKRELQAISDLEKITFFESLIDTFGPEHPLFQKNGYGQVARLKSLVETMKSENWTEAEVSSAIADYLADLPNRAEFQYQRKFGEFNKGDANPRKIEDETRKMETLKSALPAFSAYQKYLANAGRYDYQDMLLWILQAFEKDANFLARYQEQFQYILVDEYQDTNGTQNAILKKLISYWEEPNVFIVGDDDQSIYRFQGANLRNIMDFYHSFESAIESNESLIVLTRNYRSSQNILDTARGIIERNKERLTTEIPRLEKKLIAENPNVANNVNKPKVVEYDGTVHEETDIVAQIEALQKDDVDLSDVAVIYSQHRQATNIIKALEQKKIPLSVKESLDILSLPFVQKILTILEYVAAEAKQPNSAEDKLFQILHYDFFGIKARDIAMLTMAIQQKKKLQKSIPENGEAQLLIPGIEPLPTTWRSFLQDPSHFQNLGLSSQKQVGAFFGKLDTWLKDYQNEPFQLFLEKLCNTSGILSFIISSEEKTWLMRVLSSFLQFVQNEVDKNPGMKTEDLLKTIKQMQEHKVAMPLSKVIFAKNGVNFLSAHGSKGLEFSHVFLIGVNKNFWEDKKGGRNQFNFPDTLTLSNTGDALEEARRLFFVALTRAKTFLQVSYSAKNGDGAPMESSQFVSEMLENPMVESEKKSLTEEEIVNYQILLLTHKTEDLSHHFLDDTALDEILKNYRMSPTHLNRYLECPTSFYFESLLKVPTAMNASMSFGSAVHYALEYFFRDAKQKGHFEDSKHLIAGFEKSMYINRSAFTTEAFDRLMKYGKSILERLFTRYHKEWSHECVVEYGVYNAEIAGIPVSGKLDKIEFLDDGNVNVVDYKTGKIVYAREKLNPPNEKQPNGGDYWRQIVFYKLLLDADSRVKWNMISGEMDFIEPENDEFSKKKIQIFPEDLEAVKKQIETVYQKIMNHEFTQGCGKEDCTWCNFVRENF